jgi:hypothetical protein
MCLKWPPLMFVQDLFVCIETFSPYMLLCICM